MDERLRREIQELHNSVCRALADPTRIMILYTLAVGPQNVSELVEALDCPQSTISRHLKVLRDRGLVAPRREGPNVYYSLTEPKLIQAVDLMREVLRSVIARRATLLDSDL
jgi:ArsR family transcriptional regulator